jgi:hypothetical protein
LVAQKSQVTLWPGFSFLQTTPGYFYTFNVGENANIGEAKFTAHHCRFTIRVFKTAA